MKITIAMIDPDDLINIHTLTEYIEEASIDEVEDVCVNRSDTQGNELGIGDMLGSVSLVVKAASRPLEELAKAIHSWILTYKTDITIETNRGKATIKGRGKVTETLLLEIINALKE